MSFDIHQLDKSDDYIEDETITEEYQETLVNLFLTSPEGEARAEADPEVGFWTYQFMHYGYVYIGVTLPQMRLSDAEEIITRIFPRKISLHSPDDADDAIPELIAFWRYLQREYNLRQAKPILAFLHKIQPKFKGLMNDPANFGMAKSFFMQGQAAGFDMTDQEEGNQFIVAYNAALMAGEADPLPLPGDGLEPLLGPSGSSTSKKVQKQKQKQKKKRKMAKASRKKNKKKQK